MCREFNESQGRQWTARTQEERQDELKTICIQAAMQDGVVQGVRSSLAVLGTNEKEWEQLSSNSFALVNGGIKTPTY
jgi:hypothetical protein